MAPHRTLDDPAWLARLEAAMIPWRGAGVVVAVSGGSDSVGLLRALVAVGAGLELRLSVATCDHGTRAGASALDAAFVAELAERLGLPCDLGHWRSPRAAHFEADARRARYAWLLDVASKRQAKAVAVGHTSDDQAETILHRVVRGTGLRGLAGMPTRRALGPGVTLVRPILAATRRAIRDYLTTIGQDWCEDASNTDRSRTRARIRHDLLPRLAADYNPNVLAALIRLGHHAGEASRRADRQASRRLQRVKIDGDPTRITLDRAGLRELLPDARVDVLRLAWRRLGWPEAGMTQDRWDRLNALADGARAGTVEIGAGIEARLTRDRLTLQHRAEVLGSVPPLEPRPLPIPGSAAWNDGRIITTLEPFPQPAPTDEWVDRDAIQGPLTVRPARPGDRFDPLGLDGRTQPLADFFRGRGIPRLDRPLVPIVVDAWGIVWVAGHRIAHRVRRTKGTVGTVGLRQEWELDANASRIFPA